MISDKKVLAWIPARSGSKGIKDKNIKLLNNKPLIAYTIEAARRSVYVDEVMVSTDSKEIAHISEEYGAWIPALRPAELAGDTSKTIDAVMHTIDMLKTLGEKFDIFCLLQPTSPLRDELDIDKALEIYVQKGFRSVAAVSKVNDYPILIRTVDNDSRLEPLLKPTDNANSTVRRQDMPEYYRVNGSIYVNPISSINKNTSFNDNEIACIIEPSHAVDIDDMSDFALAEYYFGQK